MSLNFSAGLRFELTSTLSLNYAHTTYRTYLINRNEPLPFESALSPRSTFEQGKSKT